MYSDFTIDESDYRGRTLKKYNGRDEVVTVPENVVCIDTKAFYHKKTLKKVILPESVKRIETRAFGECRQLEEINLRSAERRIGLKAFAGCDKLGNEDGLIVIDGVVFGCVIENATHIIVPEGVHTIWQNAFLNQATLERITLPDGLKTIGEEAFRGCKMLMEIDIPDTVTEIGRYAFASCKGLEKIKLPKGLKTIKEYTFYYNTLLRSITIPEGVEEVEHGAFLACHLLKDIYIESEKIIFAEYPFYVTPEDAHIHCSRAVMRRQLSEIRQICMIDVNNGEEEIFYNRIAGLNVERMIADVSKDSSWDEPIYPKRCKVSFEKNGKAMQVDSKLKTSLRSVKRELERSMAYDSYEAAHHMITKEESLELMLKDDPNDHFGAYMYARPEIGPDAERLTDEELENRFLFLLYLAYKISDEEVLRQIGTEMPKKKDGTFAKNRILRIASSSIAIRGNGDDYIIEIVAKPTSDTDLVVSAVLRSMSAEEVFLLEEDFVSTHPEIFNLKAYYTEVEAEQEIEEIEEENTEEFSEDLGSVVVLSPKEQLQEMVLAAKSGEEKERADRWLADYREYVDRHPRVEFFGKKFVFTGIDDEADNPLVKLIEGKGGIIRKKASGKTNYLIAYPPNAGASKIETLLDHIDDGKDIKIILLEDFLPLL